MFENWVKKFRLGARVALKLQLVKKHNKSDIELWSTSFADVDANAIKILSVNFVERLKKLEISDSLFSLRKI